MFNSKKTWNKLDPPHIHLSLTVNELIGSLILAISMVIVAQVMERLDTALFGGNVLFFGNVMLFFWLTVAIYQYGLIGALIVANLNPVAAILTKTGPLAPIWFLGNTLNACFMWFTIISVDKFFSHKNEEVNWNFRIYLLIGISGYPGLFFELYAAIQNLSTNVLQTVVILATIFCAVTIGVISSFLLTKYYSSYNKIEKIR